MKAFDVGFAYTYIVVAQGQFEIGVLQFPFHLYLKHLGNTHLLSQVDGINCYQQRRSDSRILGPIAKINLIDVKQAL
jgi:hypothetical protein